MAHDVFISYSTKDKVIADAICANLENRGIRCWIAPRDILPGKKWGGSIIEAIERSKILVLLLSSNSNKSGNVIRELERAVDTDTTVIPFRVEEILPSEDIAYFIAGTHWLDALTPPLEKHIESLAETIGILLKSPKPEKDISALDYNVSSYNAPKKQDISKKYRLKKPDILKKYGSARNLGVFISIIFVGILLISIANMMLIPTKTYSNNGVTFNYPEGWREYSINNISHPDTDYAITVFGDPNSVDTSGNVNTAVIIKRKELASGYILGQEYNSYYGSKANDADFLPISDTKLNLNGKTAYEKIYERNYNGPQKTRAVWIDKNGYIYIIQCTSLTGDFESQKGNFDIIINSFKVL